ncbi:hypothetical protein [Hyunsoonleella ulvae]|uniref:hypothetical protein n=1 Tax=Hyunsoonleella ulvae TaxID=2799948 RepID=UPI00193A5995|nr:hypothetical protein [Hyunsoonleella ulvae]
MKASLMSILVDSDLEYEFPYQIGLLFHERFNNVFEKEIIIANPKYKDWILSLNLSHSKPIKDILLKGPDIDKRNKIVTFSIFNGIIKKGISSKEITIFFMENLLINLKDILELLKVEIAFDLVESFFENFLNDLNINYEKYIDYYTEEDDELF